MKYILSVVLMTLFVGVSVSQEKPNILWLTFEDTPPQFIGCYGDTAAETPVMDFMAEQGVRFKSAFSKGTVCSPSGSAIITGVPTYKMGSGNHRSGFPIPETIKGFPEYLKVQGYYVTDNSKTDYNIAEVKQFTADTWDESSNAAGWWNRENKQPFFSVFNIPDSHQSRTMSMSYEWYEKHQDLLKTMRERLKTEILKEKDIHFLPEYELGEISKNSTPYEFRQDKEAYNLEQIFEVANSVGLIDEASYFLKQLKNKDAYIRYWAALGLYNLRHSLQPKDLTRIKPHSEDTFPSVQIALAATLYSATKDENSSNILKACITDDNPHLALAAINYTLYFDDRDVFNDSVKKGYATTSTYKVKASCTDFMDLQGIEHNKLIA